MQISSSISSSLETFDETFDELNSITVATGFTSNASVENEFGSLLGTGGLSDSLLSRLSVSLSKYYTVSTLTDTLTLGSVSDLLVRLQHSRCKITIKYSAQQVYEAALETRDHQAIMFALSACEEVVDGACMHSLWTNIVLAGIDNVLEKIKTVGKKKKARQEFVDEWNHM